MATYLSHVALKYDILLPISLLLEKNMNKTDKFWNKTIVVWIGALICCAFWGSAFPCIKLGYEMTQIDTSDTASIILYAGTRFTLAGIIAVILGSVIQRRLIYPSLQAIPKVLWLSLLQTVLQYLFFYIGLANTTGVKASIIEGVNVFVAVIVSGLIFRQEIISFRIMLGCVIGFAGVVLVNITGGGIDTSLSLIGEGFIFISTVSYAFSSVYLKKFSKTENPVMLSGYQFIFGGFIMMLSGRIMGGRLGILGQNAVEGKIAAIGMLLWLAIVSAVAYSLWGILLKHNSVSRVAVFGFMNPVFGVILSAWLLKESEALGIKCLVALVLVCVGIYIVNLAPKSNKKANKSN